MNEDLNLTNVESEAHIFVDIRIYILIGVFVRRWTGRTLYQKRSPPRCQFRAAALHLPLAGSPPLVWVLQRFFRLLPPDKFALPARQAARTGGAGGGWRTGVCPPSSPGGSQTAWANKQPWYYHNPPVTEPMGLLMIIIMVVFSVSCLVFVFFFSAIDLMNFQSFCVRGLIYVTWRFCVISITSQPACISIMWHNLNFDLWITTKKSDQSEKKHLKLFNVH